MLEHPSPLLTTRCTVVIVLIYCCCLSSPTRKCRRLVPASWQLMPLWFGDGTLAMQALDYAPDAHLHRTW